MQSVRSSIHCIDQKEITESIQLNPYVNGYNIH